MRKNEVFFFLSWEDLSQITRRNIFLLFISPWESQDKKRLKHFFESKVLSLNFFFYCFLYENEDQGTCAMQKNGSCIRNFINNLKQENWLVKVKMKPWIEISVNIDVSILGFYRYIGNIGEISVDIFTQILVRQKLSRIDENA